MPGFLIGHEAALLVTCGNAGQREISLISCQGNREKYLPLNISSGIERCIRSVLVLVQMLHISTNTGNNINIGASLQLNKKHNINIYGKITHLVDYLIKINHLSFIFIFYTLPFFKPKMRQRHEDSSLSFTTLAL